MLNHIELSSQKHLRRSVFKSFRWSRFSLSVELIPSAVTHLNRAELFPIVILLFSVHAERLSPANNAADNWALLCYGGVTQTRMANLRRLPAATDCSRLMVAARDGEMVKIKVDRTKQTCGGNLASGATFSPWPQLMFLPRFKGTKLDPTNPFSLTNSPLSSSLFPPDSLRSVAETLVGLFAAALTLKFTTSHLIKSFLLI